MSTPSTPSSPSRPTAGSPAPGGSPGQAEPARAATLSPSDILLDHDAYAARRAEVRQRMITLRRQRRVAVGDMLVFEFENVDTIRYQVQEMVFTERMTDPGEVAHEVAAYGRMLPTSHELCATLFIELDDVATVRDELVRLAGVQHATSLRIQGGTVPGLELPGLDQDPLSPTDTVSVHVVRFQLDDRQRDAFRDPETPVELVVEHASYSGSTPIRGATRLSLISDLALT